MKILKIGLILSVLLAPHIALGLLPDGGSIRLGTWINNHDIEAGPISLNDNNSVPIEKFPLNLAWRESLIGTNTFRQLFFDVEFPSKSFNFRSESNHAELTSNFFNASELAFTQANPNWALSADMRTWSLAFGIQFGIFIDSGRGSRFLKSAIGVNIGYVYYNIDLHLCSSFIEDGSKSGFLEKKSGTCSNKRQIDNVRITSLGFGGAFNITLYERLRKNWSLEVFSVSVGTVGTYSKNQFEERGIQYKLDVQTSFVSADFVRFHYYFF